jgi:hypothetical protein
VLEEHPESGDKEIESQQDEQKIHVLRRKARKYLATNRPDSGFYRTTMDTPHNIERAPDKNRKTNSLEPFLIKFRNSFLISGNEQQRSAEHNETRHTPPVTNIDQESNELGRKITTSTEGVGDVKNNDTNNG